MATKEKRKKKTDAEKQADFTRLAEKHVNTCIASFARISKLGSPGKYLSAPAQISAMQSALAEAAEAAFAALKNPGKVTAGFKFK